MNPPQWTIDAIGEMHRLQVTAKALALEIGWHPKYLSAVLNGHRGPKGAEKTVNAALLRLEIKKGRAAHGLDTDLKALVDKYREVCPEYADKLQEAINLPASQA